MEIPICTYICMYVTMYACMYVSMYVWMDGWMDGFDIRSSLPGIERARVLRRAVDILRSRNDELAELEVRFSVHMYVCTYVRIYRWTDGCFKS